MPHSKAYEQFIASMTLTMEDWREGNGYDLDALDEFPKREHSDLIKVLQERIARLADWRDAEALATMGTTAAIDALRAAMSAGDAEFRLHVAEQLAELEQPVDLEGAIIDALRTTDLTSGLSYAIDTAEEHPSPRLQETLLDLALNGNEDQRVHCAALALYHGGKAEEAFDWDHRPFFLKFGEEDRKTQIEAYKELCQRLGVAPKVK